MICEFYVYKFDVLRYYDMCNTKYLKKGVKYHGKYTGNKKERNDITKN